MKKALKHETILDVLAFSKHHKDGHSQTMMWMYMMLIGLPDIQHSVRDSSGILRIYNTLKEMKL